MPTKMWKSESTFNYPFKVIDVTQTPIRDLNQDLHFTKALISLALIVFEDLRRDASETSSPSVESGGKRQEEFNY